MVVWALSLYKIIEIFFCRKTIGDGPLTGRVGTLVRFASKRCKKSGF